jgi:hypothetical protein
LGRRARWWMRFRSKGRRPDFPEKRLYTVSDLQAGEWKSYSIGARDEAARPLKRRPEAHAAMHGGGVGSLLRWPSGRRVGRWDGLTPLRFSKSICYMAAMKLRHAVALALVGWYLILPPPDTNGRLRLGR